MSDNNTLQNQSEYFYLKKYNCPVCEKDFEAYTVRSTKLRTISTDTDFMPRYKDIDPNHYEVLLCPSCGYAALTTHFATLTERQQGLLKNTIAKEYTHRDYVFPYALLDVVARYEQAIKCAECISAKVSQKAFINLRLAWVLRAANVSANVENEYILKAYEGLTEAFSTERFPLGNMDETTAKYLIADLARRLGKMGDAMRWVADVIVAKGIPSAIKERAINLKDLIREGKTT